MCGEENNDSNGDLGGNEGNEIPDIDTTTYTEKGFEPDLEEKA